MYRYTWHAIRNDGSVLERWNPDGSENKPDPWDTRQFHLIPTQADCTPVSVFVPKGCMFRYVKRRHQDVNAAGQDVTQNEDLIYVFGWIHPDLPDAACFTFLLPDGRVEQSNDFNHITRYERNLEVIPLTPYETTRVSGLTEAQTRVLSTVLTSPSRTREIWLDFFGDAEIVEDEEESLSALDESFGPPELGLPQ